MKSFADRGSFVLWIRFALSFAAMGLAASASADSFVGVGNNGKGVRSDDTGVTWTSSNHFNGSMRGIAFANGRFVAVGDGVSFSDNFGQTWSAATTPPSNNMGNVAFANGRFVAVGGNGHGAYSDDDGVTWTNTSHGNGNMFDVAFGNNRFVAVGLGGVASYSVDGISWTTSNHNNGQASSVAFGNGVFVSIGGSTSIHASRSVDNGQSWSPVTFFGLGNTRGVAFGNNRFVTVGFGRIRYSDDNGDTWLDANTPGTLTLTAVAFGDNTFVAIGDNNSAISTDGINWAASQAHNNPQQQAIAFGSAAPVSNLSSANDPVFGSNSLTVDSVTGLA